MALRWGIASTGKISHDFVCAVQILPERDHQVVAVAARNESDAETFARAHNIPKHHAGYERLAKDPEIDIVYVGNINTKHLETAKLMLANGKHVLCEKPLTLNEKQTRELIEFAQKHKRYLMEAVWSRCFPAYRELRKLLDAGTIGDVLHVRVEFGLIIDHVERVNVKEMGGSCTLDLGVYALQFAQFVYKGLKPTDVTVAGHLNQNEVDDSVTTVLKYPNGKIAVCSLSCRAQFPNEAIIVGTKGTIRLPYFWCPTTLITPHKTYDFPLPETKAEFVHIHSAGLAYEAEDSRLCIKNNLLENPVMPLRDSLELSQLMDKLRKGAGNVFPEDA